MPRYSEINNHRVLLEAVAPQYDLVYDRGLVWLGSKQPAGRLFLDYTELLANYLSMAEAFHDTANHAGLIDVCDRSGFCLEFNRLRKKFNLCNGVEVHAPKCERLVSAQETSATKLLELEPL